MLKVNQLAGFGGYAETAASSTPLLDLIGTSATGAYSLRKLRAAYAGSAIRVRESGGGTLADIGFDANGDLDTAALATHCGANNGFVRVFYDQSGNARDLTQTTDASQPQIVSAGSLITTLSAKGCLSFDGSDDVLPSGIAISSFIAAAAYTMFIAARATTGTNTGTPYTEACLIGEAAGGYWATGTNSSSGIQFYQFDGGQKTTSVASSYPASMIVLSKYDGTNLKGYVGGGSGGSVAAGSVQVVTNLMTLGRATSDSLDGFMGEAVLFGSALSAADCNTLASNMATYWGQSWSNIS